MELTHEQKQLLIQFESQRINAEQSTHDGTDSSIVAKVIELREIALSYLKSDLPTSLKAKYTRVSDVPKALYMSENQRQFIIDAKRHNLTWFASSRIRQGLGDGKFGQIYPAVTVLSGEAFTPKADVLIDFMGEYGTVYAKH